MRARAATSADLSEVVAMARAMRRSLAAWSPVHFRPREGADELHEAYLAFLVDSAEHDTRVVVDAADTPVAFFHLVGQPSHTWVDDLCVARPADEAEVALLLAGVVPTPWVTCVSCSDERRAAALRAGGLQVASTYWSRSLAGHQAARPVPDGRLGDVPPVGPRHTFGGRPLDPAAPGALVVADDELGHVIGSPGIEPPLHDPGGPTCVVDRIRGADRAALLDVAMAAAAARGDTRMLVVCDGGDDDLAAVLSRAAFRAEVDLLART